jgi:hypothetical protein
MTSLLGRLLRLFPESVPLEDLFTEAVARLFETRPQLCLAWLEETGLTTPLRVAGAGQEYVRVTSQRTFVALEHHDTDSRPDIMIEVYRSSAEEPIGDGAVADVVMIESKIGSREGPEQLRRYAEHLDEMTGFSNKALVYITRGYDPKESGEIISSMGDDVRFEQLRWHDFYRFLQTVEKDALVQEVMTFMEEQDMARSYRFSTADLMALSGVPRAFEILDETLSGEVKAELESFAGNRVRREAVGLDNLRRFGAYLIIAPLHEWDLFCALGYSLRKPDGYPAVSVKLQTKPRAGGRDASIAVMKRVTLRDGWEGHSLDDPTKWSDVRCEKSLASLLPEEDHIAAVQRFFVESIRQLREELTAFKKERPDLPWAGA